MIRKHVGNLFHLFAQDDHARMSGKLAEHYGNKWFSKPDPAAEVVAAVGLHDCGWPLHDDRPTLNKEGLPADVFETPLPIALEVWREAVERVKTHPPYTQLIVSLHVMGLSGFAAGHAHDRLEQFELNKFQHRQIEIQEKLRKAMGMALDVPLRLGLAVDHGHPQEEKLRRNHLILQTLDRISLALCSTEMPFAKIEGIVPRTGAAAVSLTFTRTGPWALKVEPWPFDAQEIEVEMPYRAVEARKYENVEEFRVAYSEAAEMKVKMIVHV
jgi:hypothetical protein